MCIRDRSPIGEFIVRFQTGCKKIKDPEIMSRLEPLFYEVYQKAKMQEPLISDSVRLYMNDDEDVYKRQEEIRIKQRYKIEKVLGQGGFGVTYLAYDEELCQEVVLKKYRWEHGSLDNEVINKRDYYKKQRKAFLNEARILSSLFDIKEVVKVLDYFEERENAYIVMEFVQGISLRRCV